MAYRNDHEALRAQCDALRQELALARRSSVESERLSAELQDKLAQLEQAKAEQLADSSLGRRMQSAAMWYGVGLGLLVVAGAGAIYYKQHRGTRPVLPSPSAMRALTAVKSEVPAWFAKVRRHCNPLEVNDVIRRNPAPPSDEGQGYLAACLALADKTDRAQQVVDALKPRARVAAARIVFEIAHPIAERGDEVAAGPAMELVLRYQPDNDLAVYHAGMAAHGQKSTARANELLRRFLAIHKRQDIWRHKAEAALRRPTNR